MSENITIENLPKLETNIEADFSVPIEKTNTKLISKVRKLLKKN